MNIILHSLSLSDLLLDSNDPAIAIGGVGSLEAVNLVSNFEPESFASLFGSVGDIVLETAGQQPRSQQEYDDLRGGSDR